MLKYGTGTVPVVPYNIISAPPPSSLLYIGIILRCKKKKFLLLLLSFFITVLSAKQDYYSSVLHFQQFMLSFILGRVPLEIVGVRVEHHWIYVM